jgi:type IV pilus assembly protein PilY1
MDTRTNSCQKCSFRQCATIKIAQGLAAIKSIDTTTDEDGTANANLKISSQTYPDVTKAASGTPTVAYAEAAAYMMGTNTGGAPLQRQK